jgi:hypothetical protein
MTTRSARPRPAHGEGDVVPLIVLLIGAALVVKFAWLLAAVLTTVAVGIGVGKWWASWDDRAAARRRRAAGLCARADRQHAAVLAGDGMLGVYGDYPPAV